MFIYPFIVECVEDWGRLSSLLFKTHHSINTMATDKNLHYRKPCFFVLLLPPQAFDTIYIKAYFAV